MGSVFRMHPENDGQPYKHIYTIAHLRYGNLVNVVAIPQAYENDPSNILAIDLMVKTKEWLYENNIPHSHQGDKITWEYNGLSCSIELE